MQAIAGTRGSKSYEADYLDSDIYSAQDLGDVGSDELPDRDIEFLIDTANINLQDQIRKDENIPLQFVYEAAHCRIYYTRDMLFNFSGLWKYAADATWSNPGLCVKDSINQPSALKVDTKGPTQAQKASWAASKPKNPIVTTNTSYSLPEFLKEAGPPDEDFAGKAVGSSCQLQFPGKCGDLSYYNCVAGPYCDTERGVFYEQQPQCVLRCGHCKSNEVCGSGACTRQDRSGNQFQDTCQYCAPKHPPTYATCTGRNTVKQLPKGTHQPSLPSLSFNRRPPKKARRFANNKRMVSNGKRRSGRR